VWHISLLLNDQMIPKIMGKMPFTDWMEWALIGYTMMLGMQLKNSWSRSGRMP
jgi:hypothetical protein